MEVDERTLIHEAQKDPNSFGRLYERNFHRVYAFIASRIRNRDEAEDLTADVFHKALANIGQFEWRGIPFAAWLLKIAANTMADRIGSFAKEQGNPIQEEPYISLENIETRQTLPAGGYASAGSATRDPEKIRGAEIDSRSCEGSSTHGRSY